MRSSETLYFFSGPGGRSRVRDRTQFRTQGARSGSGREFTSLEICTLSSGYPVPDAFKHLGTERDRTQLATANCINCIPNERCRVLYRTGNA